MRSLIIGTPPPQNLFKGSNQEELHGEGMWQIQRQDNAHWVFLVRPDGRRPFGRPRNGWEVILKWTFKV